MFVINQYQPFKPPNSHHSQIQWHRKSKSFIFIFKSLFLYRGSDPMMAAGGVPSPHSHPGMMQPQQAPGQSPLARYMMAQSPQTGIYRPQMSPMNMMSKNDS
jgi:hypothetical protein